MFPEPAPTSLGICGHAEIVNFHGRVIQNQLLVFELKVSPYSPFKSIFFALDVALSVNFDPKMRPKSIHDRFDGSKSFHQALNISFDAPKTRPRAPQKLPRLPQGAPKRLLQRFETSENVTKAVVSPPKSILKLPRGKQMQNITLSDAVFIHINT